MRMGKWFFGVFSISLAMVCLGVSAASPEDLLVFLTTSPEEKIPSSEFDCREKIYVYAVFNDLKDGIHKAAAYWNNPKGRIQQVSSHEFRSAGKPYAVWLWLKLHPSRGGDILGDIMPFFGMEDFIGRWEVELYLDGKIIRETAFYVLC